MFYRVPVECCRVTFIGSRNVDGQDLVGERHASESRGRELQCGIVLNRVGWSSDRRRWTRINFQGPARRSSGAVRSVGGLTTGCKRDR